MPWKCPDTLGSGVTSALGVAWEVPSSERGPALALGKRHAKGAARGEGRNSPEHPGWNTAATGRKSPSCYEPTQMWQSKVA